MNRLVAPHVSDDHVELAIDDILRADRSELGEPVVSIIHGWSRTPSRRASQGAQIPAIDLSRYLSRALTKIAMRTPAVGEMMSSIAAIAVERRLAQALCTLIGELMRTIVGMAQDRTVRVFFACEWDGDVLMIALACPELTTVPVFSSASARSFDRATRLALALDGKLVRGIKDGMMLFGAAFGWLPLGGPSEHPSSWSS